MPEVKLKVNGMIYGGWKTVDIRRSIDMAANTFALGLTDRWAGQEQRRPIRMGSLCEVWIDDEKIITGYVDDILPRYNAKERSIEVKGRSKVADLIDCALSLTGKESSQFNGLNFFQLAERFARHFGIKVIDEVGKFKPARARVLDPGKRVFEWLEEITREEAVFLTSNADGDLVIRRASNLKLATALVLGKNIREADGRFSMKDRFSQYHFFSQTWGNNDSAAANAHIKGYAEDLQMRFRPTVIMAEDAETREALRRRAEWQRNISYGRSMQAAYTVAGWRHADGLWEPNRNVHIMDEWMGLDGVWWLISEARFRLDEDGQRTELTVMPKEAFDLVPLPPKDGKLRWSPLQ